MSDPQAHPVPHVVHVIDELPPDGAQRLIVEVLQNASRRFRYSVLCIVAGNDAFDLRKPCLDVALHAICSG